MQNNKTYVVIRYVTRYYQYLYDIKMQTSPFYKSNVLETKSF